MPNAHRRRREGAVEFRRVGQCELNRRQSAEIVKAKFHYAS